VAKVEPEEIIDSCFSNQGRSASIIGAENFLRAAKRSAPSPLACAAAVLSDLQSPSSRPTNPLIGEPQLDAYFAVSFHANTFVQIGRFFARSSDRAYGSFAWPGGREDVARGKA
jgi:hypothetical protein